MYGVRATRYPKRRKRKRSESSESADTDGVVKADRLLVTGADTAVSGRGLQVVEDGSAFAKDDFLGGGPALPCRVEPRLGRRPDVGWGCKRDQVVVVRRGRRRREIGRYVNRPVLPA